MLERARRVAKNKLPKTRGEGTAPAVSKWKSLLAFALANVRYSRQRTFDHKFIEFDAARQGAAELSCLKICLAPAYQRMRGLGCIRYRLEMTYSVFCRMKKLKPVGCH